MAQKLSEDIKAKVGNCFFVKNIEKEKYGYRNNLMRFQKEKYILVHVKDSERSYVWMMTETEFKNCSLVESSNEIYKTLEKGVLYYLAIGKATRYIVKLQDFDGSDIVLSVGKATHLNFCRRASAHNESIVDVEKSILSKLFG